MDGLQTEVIQEVPDTDILEAKRKARELEETTQELQAIKTQKLPNLFGHRWVVNETGGPKLGQHWIPWGGGGG